MWQGFKKSFYYLNAAIGVALTSYTFLWCLTLPFEDEKIKVGTDLKVLVPIILFSSLFMLLLDGFNVTKRKRVECIVSNAFAVLMADLFTIIIFWVYAGLWFGIRRVLLTYFIQVVLVSLWVLVASKIYLTIKRPKKSVIVCYDKKNAEYYVNKIKRCSSEFDVIDIVSYTDDFFYSSIIDCDAVFLVDLTSKKREYVSKYCFALNKEIYILPELYEISVRNSVHEQIDDIPFFACNALSMTFEQRIAKRILDFVVAIIGLVATSPLFLICALAIKAHDGGPIFFKQERITREYKRFNVYKFRTMVTDAEKYSGAVLSTKDDPRITKVGKILRATRMDELPQLINILIGDMSLVGPRPERDVFIQEYIKDVPEFVYRLNVKAGLTGLAQVYGKYNTTPQDKLKLDLLYIQNYSFGMDIKLLLKTVKVVFTKESTEGVDKEGTDWYKDSEGDE